MAGISVPVTPAEYQLMLRRYLIEHASQSDGRAGGQDDAEQTDSSD